MSMNFGKKVKEMANLDIRSAIKQANLKHWEVADLLNISETTLVRKLRKELSNEEKRKIFKVLKRK